MRPSPHPRMWFADRARLTASNGYTIDGIWIGADVDELRQTAALQRVEDALRLMKKYDRHRYGRMQQDLSRVWVRLLLSSSASFNRAARACQLDPRFVLDESVSLAELASAIVHEATHARLASRRIAYQEGKRRRIELTCRRQELLFLSRVPDTRELQNALRAWLAEPPDDSFWTDGSLAARRREGLRRGLHYLAAPIWLIAVLSTGVGAARWTRERFRGTSRATPAYRVNSR